MMADNQLLLDDFGGGDDIFVYTGGEQRVPRDVKRVRIAENVDTVPERAFIDCVNLIEVEGHDKLKKIEENAFRFCHNLRWVKRMTGLIEIERTAFYECVALSDVDFGKLEIIGQNVFGYCESLRSINMPSIRRVGVGAFQSCDALTDAALGKDLERIERAAFNGCAVLRRIVIPLKGNLVFDEHAFTLCENLSRVDVLDGGIHKTISSLHLKTWRNEMKEESDRINLTRPGISGMGKHIVIREWITRVLQRIEHYKTEHKVLVKEAMALLELALWKAKLLNGTDEKKCNVDVVPKKAKIDDEAVRKEHRVTCGASIVIKNVLPFLVLE